MMIYLLSTCSFFHLKKKEISKVQEYPAAQNYFLSEEGLHIRQYSHMFSEH